MIRFLFALLLGFVWISCSGGGGENPFFQGSQRTRGKEGGAVDRDRGNRSRDQEPENQVKSPRDLVLDILFVLDTSSQMNFYLDTAFQSRLVGFLSHLEETDFRVFFTNSDVTNEGLWFRGFRDMRALNGAAMNLEGAQEGVLLKRKYIDKDLPDYRQVFQNTITHTASSKCRYPPFCHGKWVQPLRALMSSFTANDDHFRDEADLVAIVITNTDEEPLDKPDQRTSPAEVMEEFRGAYGTDKKLYVFGLIVVPGDEECLKEEKKQRRKFFSREKNHYGHSIQRLVEVSDGGQALSLCLEDYSVVGEKLVEVATGADEAGAAGSQLNDPENGEVLDDLDKQILETYLEGDSGYEDYEGNDNDDDNSYGDD